MYLEQGDTDRGIAEVKEALRLYPTFAEAYETLGLAYTEQGDWPAATTHLQRALELDPTLAVGRNHLGRLYMAQGRIDAAIATFQQLVAQHPNASEARHNLAVAYAHRGDQEQALTAFRAAIRLRPDFYAARLDLAALALDMRRPQDAIEALAPMLETAAVGHQGESPFDPVDVHYRLGLAYIMADRLADAVRELELVVQNEPKHAEAHLYLGSLYYRQGDFDRAWHHARQAERLGAPAAELLAALHRAAPASE
jgi:protein O-GlcNAc transferase